MDPFHHGCTNSVFPGFDTAFSAGPLSRLSDLPVAGYASGSQLNLDGEEGLKRKDFSLPLSQLAGTVNGSVRLIVDYEPIEIPCSALLIRVDPGISPVLDICQIK